MQSRHTIQRVSIFFETIILFFLAEASLVQAKLLGLGPRYFFSHYPGH